MIYHFLLLTTYWVPEDIIIVKCVRLIALIWSLESNFGCNFSDQYSSQLLMKKLKITSSYKLSTDLRNLCYLIFMIFWNKMSGVLIVKVNNVTEISYFYCFKCLCFNLVAGNWFYAQRSLQIIDFIMFSEIIWCASQCKCYNQIRK